MIWSKKPDNLLPSGDFGKDVYEATFVSMTQDDQYIVKHIVVDLGSYSKDQLNQALESLGFVSTQGYKEVESIKRLASEAVYELMPDGCQETLYLCSNDEEVKQKLNDLKWVN